MQQRLTEQRRRESKVVLRAAVCESEKRKLSETVAGLQRAVQPAQKQMRALMLDPSVNAEIMRLREQVKDLERREKAAQQELEASQFQASSIAGKKLMQKCKELQAENEQLGKELSEGKVAKLESTIALQKEHAKELRRSLAESREWVDMLDEELEVAQGTIFNLRRELHVVKQKHGAPSPTQESATAAAPMEPAAAAATEAQ